MSDLNHPDPLNPMQSRAYALLRALAGGKLSRPELVELNGGRDKDTRLAMRFLRDHNHAHVCDYTDQFEPVYAAGIGVDVRPPTGEAAAAKKRARPVKIPPPDPLLAALFGRPATV